MIKDTTIQYFKTGSYIFIEDDKNNDKIYLIENGEIELYGLKMYKNLLKTGDIFGYISSFSNKPRFTTAFCKSDSSIVQFTRLSFFNALINNIDILTKVLEGFANELRFYDNLVITQQRSNFVTDYEQSLFELGTYYMENKELHHALYIFKKYKDTYPDGKKFQEVKKSTS